MVVQIVHVLLCILYALSKLKLHEHILCHTFILDSSPVHKLLTRRKPQLLYFFPCLFEFLSVHLPLSNDTCMEVVSQCASHTSATPAWYKWPHLFFPPLSLVFVQLWCKFIPWGFLCVHSIWDVFATLLPKVWGQKSVGLHGELQRDCGAIIGRTPSFHKSQLTNLKFRSLFHPNIIFFTNICCTQYLEHLGKCPTMC